MISFSINSDSVKLFMSKLLKSEAFDSFEVRNIWLETIVKYEIKGDINRDYLDDNEDRVFVKWKEIKPYVLSLIQGCKRPKFLKIVLSLEKRKVEELDKNGQAMFLNLVYENNQVLGTTGTSQKVFSMDKKLEITWENEIIRFFKKNNILIKILW